MKTITLQSGYLSEFFGADVSSSAIKFNKKNWSDGSVSYHSPVLIPSYVPLEKEEPRTLDVDFESLVQWHKDNEFPYSVYECGVARHYQGCGCFEEITHVHSGDPALGGRELHPDASEPCYRCQGGRESLTSYRQLFLCANDSIKYCAAAFLDTEDFLGDKYSYFVEKVDLSYRAVNR